jgi:hypothetical protein
MTIRKLPGSQIESNTITITQMSNTAWAEVYAASSTANAAYNRANTALTTANNASGGFSKSFLMSGL